MYMYTPIYNLTIIKPMRHSFSIPIGHRDLDQGLASCFASVRPLEIISKNILLCFYFCLFFHSTTIKKSTTK